MGGEKGFLGNVTRLFDVAEHLGEIPQQAGLIRGNKRSEGVIIIGGGAGRSGAPHQPPLAHRPLTALPHPTPLYRVQRSVVGKADKI